MIVDGLKRAQAQQMIDINAAAATAKAKAASAIEKLTGAQRRKARLSAECQQLEMTVAKLEKRFKSNTAQARPDPFTVVLHPFGVHVRHLIYIKMHVVSGLGLKPWSETTQPNTQG